MVNWKFALRRTLLVGSLIGAIWSSFAHAQVVAQSAQEAEQRLQKVARIVAQVSDVWVKDDRYKALHKELSNDYSGAPDYAKFVADEQWVAVISSRGLMHAGIYKGRGRTDMNLQLGDIVEMNVRHRSGPRKAKTYEDLNQITKVICKAGAADYAQCAAANPFVWFDVDGQRVEQFP